LGLRSEGRTAARAAYVGYFSAFPDLAPDDESTAFGDNVMVTWGHLTGTSGGDWLGVPPTGGSFRVPFTNVTTFAEGRMAGETIYFDLATLYEQPPSLSTPFARQLRSELQRRPRADNDHANHLTWLTAARPAATERRQRVHDDRRSPRQNARRVVARPSPSRRRAPPRKISRGSGVRGDDERAGLEVHDALALEGTECVGDRGPCVVGAFGSVQEALGDRGTELDDDVGDCSRVSCRVQLVGGQPVDLHVHPAGAAEHAPNNVG
jgi:predicted ester cyclase